MKDVRAAFGAVALALAFLFGVSEPRAFERSGLSELSIVQYLLIWTGDYNGMVDGIVGPKSAAAIEDFMLRRFGRIPENIDSKHEDALIEDAYGAMLVSGFVVVKDTRLGVTYGVPSAIVERIPGEDPRRLQFRSINKDIEIEIAYIPDKYVSLDQLYRRLTSLSGRKVSYSIFQKSWFILSGSAGSKNFYVRYYGNGREIRGFSISYSSSKSRAVERIVVAMSNVFRPSAYANDPLIRFLEELQAISSDARAGRILAPEIAAPTPPAPTTPPQPQAPPKSGSGSGFFVDGAGHVLTNAHVVEGCGKVSVYTTEVKVVAIDSTNDLALLYAPSLAGSPSLAFRSDAARLGEEVVAAGFPLQGVLADSINITPGVLSSLSGLRNDSRYLQTTAAVQPGNSGGPLVDRTGKVVGVIAGKLDAIFAMEKGGFIPEGVNFAIRHDTVRPFLEMNNIAFTSAQRDATARPVEAVAELVRKSVVPIQCRIGP